MLGDLCLVTKRDLGVPIKRDPAPLPSPSVSRCPVSFVMGPNWLPEPKPTCQPHRLFTRRVCGRVRRSREPSRCLSRQERACRVHAEPWWETEPAALACGPGEGVRFPQEARKRCAHRGTWWIAHTPLEWWTGPTQWECAESLVYSVPSGCCKLVALRCWRGASAELLLSTWLLAPFSPLLAFLPVRGMITVVKENRPKEGVRAPNEQPAPLPPQLSFLGPSLPSFLPHCLSASLSSSPRNQCTCGALLGAPVLCQRWTLGFRDPQAVGGVSGLSSVLPPLDVHVETSQVAILAAEM